MNPIRYLLVTDKHLHDRLLPDLTPRSDLQLIGSCATGERALLMTVTLKPHVIVLDLDLLPTHALQLIRYIRKTAGTRCIRILAISSSDQGSAIQQALDEADSRLFKPIQAQKLLTHVQTLGLTAITTPFEYLITSILLQLGVPSHLHGYKYIRSALISLEKNPELLYHMMHGLYVIIAEEHHTHPSNVERAIRNAITQTWNRGGAEPYRRLLGLQSDFVMEKPTNSEFLAYVSQCIHLQWERCQTTHTNWYEITL